MADNCRVDAVKPVHPVIDKGVQIVLKHTGFIHTAIVSAVLLSFPAFALARGGSGGGGGGHGGGGFLGGGGAIGARSIVGSGYRGYTGGGFRGYAGYGRGYSGYRGWGCPGYRWGYPYYGYGLGLGLGLGLGYGLASGYGYGYPGYGYGNATYTSGSYYGTSANAAPNLVVTASATVAPDSATTARSREFADRGETHFKAGDYEGAVYDWRHAVVDDPQNPILLLKLGQGLFATGKYEEAAGATQAAMHQLPKLEWGAVVSRYQELYGNAQDYTRQLRALEKALNNKPGDPALRFLAGYHYGYLGFLKPSIEQLEKVVQSEPRDEMAKQLRDEMKSKLAMVDIPLAVPPAPAPETYWINK